jgi:hypothetical protein
MSEQRSVAEALAIAVSLRVPVLLWGAPGTGKSSVVRALGAALSEPVETVIASLREPADFAGLPVVADDGSIRLAEPSWARRLVAAGRGILFLDEVTTAPPAVQAALLRVVLERVVGDVALPSAVAVIAAANPPEVAAGGWDLTPPLANRFCHLDWPVDSGAYLEALAGGWPVPEVHASTPSDDHVAARVRGVLAGFLRSRPALLQAMPQDSASSGRAWPSPRTWDMALNLWVGAESREVGHGVILQLISGCVGAGAARELLVWEQEADLPDPEDVLADPGRFRLPDRGDRQFAVLSSIAAAVVANPTRERWNAAFEIVEQAVRKGAPDIAAVASRTLAAHMPAGIESLPSGLTALAPVMSKAGLLRTRAGRG